MKNKTKFFILAAAAAVLLTLGYAHRVAGEQTQEQQATPAPEEPSLRHDQEIYIAALEWCESRGIPSAVNPKDRDGTPSYGGFQFKPSTLAYFSQKYGIAVSPTMASPEDRTKADVMDYDTQHKVLEAMVRDAGHINWSQQFPDCTKKIGRPPQVSTAAL